MGISNVASKDAGLQKLVDKSALHDLVTMERFVRDQGKFDLLRDHYIADSRVRVTWFDGTGAEFADASEKQYENGHRGLHRIFPIYTRIEGDRALVESHGEIMGRSELDGSVCDLLTYCRFFSRAVRTDAGWRLATLDCIYVRDSILPVDAGVLEIVDQETFNRMRPSYRHLGYLLHRIGYEIDQELAGGRPARPHGKIVQRGRRLAVQ